MTDVAYVFHDSEIMMICKLQIIHVVSSNVWHKWLQKFREVIARQARTNLDQSWTLVKAHYQIIVF